MGDAVFVTVKQTWERGRTTQKSVEGWVTKRLGLRVYEDQEGGEDRQPRAKRAERPPRLAGLALGRVPGS